MNSISDEDQIENTCAVVWRDSSDIPRIIYSLKESVDRANAVAAELSSRYLNNEDEEKQNKEEDEDEEEEEKEEEKNRNQATYATYIQYQNN